MKSNNIPIKDKLKIVFAIISFISAIVIGFWAMLIPPEGIIDPSILWFVAQLLVFITTLLGLNLTIDGSRHFISNQKNESMQEN